MIKPMVEDEVGRLASGILQDPEWMGWHLDAEHKKIVAIFVARYHYLEDRYVDKIIEGVVSVNTTNQAQIYKKMAEYSSSV